MRICKLSGWHFKSMEEAKKEEEESETTNTTNTSTSLYSKEEEKVVITDVVPPEERESVGWMCKRMLDAGRVLHLRSMGYHSYLAQYCDRKVTPENILLIATREKKE